MENKDPLWTKAFIMLLFGNLFIFMSFQMLIPALPPYVKAIGGTGLQIGLVTGLFSFGAVFIRPFIGHMLEYKTRKPLVVIGSVSLLLITVLYPLSQIILVFLLFRLVHGLAWGWSTTVNGTAAVDIVPNSRLGEGMGYYGLSITIGMIVAPSLGIFLFQATSFANVIYVSCALGLIAIGLLAAVHYRTPPAVKNTRKEDLTFTYFGSFIEKTSWFPALVTFIVTFGYGAIATFIVIFGEERGIDQIFLFYLINAIMASVSRPVAGKWFDRNGPKGIVLLCIFLAFVGTWVLSFAHSNLMIILAGIFFGIGFGSLMPTLQSWTLSQTPANRRGVANGMYFSAIDLGFGLSGLVFGILAQFVKLALLFQISSVFLIAAIIMTVIRDRKQSTARQQPAS